MQNEIDLEYQLHAYVDGDLDEDSMSRVEEYLRKNPEMAAKIRDYLRQKDDIRGFASREAVSDDAPALRGLATKLANRLKPRRQSRWRRPILVSVLLAGGWLGHAPYGPLAEGPRFAREIVQAHRLSSSDPGEMLPMSPERLSRLFSRTGEEQRVPDLRGLG